MSFSVDKPDAWVLSPYCFCPDRPWLTIDDIGYVNIGGGEDGGSVIAPIPGLTTDETALLAALLTALAIFLFLLFLLLCLLCPGGLCCGKRGFCCSKESAAKKQTAVKEPSVSSSNSVNLTAVDMKIPRAWMDNCGGFSDSEVGKKGKSGYAGWTDGDDERLWAFGDRYGHDNKGFRDEVFREAGWVTTTDLDSVYGGYDRSVRGRKGFEAETRRSGREMIAMDDYYAGWRGRKDTADSNTGLRYRSSSYGSILDKLMSPYPAAQSNHQYTTEIARGLGSRAVLYRDPPESVAETSAVPQQEFSRTTDVPVTRSRTAGTMNAVAEISLSDANSTVATLPRANETRVSTQNLVMSADNNSVNNGMREIQIDRNVQPNTVYTEYTSEYKRRVVEETETVSSL